MDVRDIDKHVGIRLRQARQFAPFSQTELGGRIDVTFQQIQKYETGANRVSAGKLYQLANLLGVEITYFFEGLPDLPAEEERHFKRENMMLALRIASIKNEGVKKALIGLLKALAEVSECEES